MNTEHIVAVYDRQLDAYLRPFTAQSLGQAIRSFRDEINRQGSDLNAHPDDYSLHKVGEWNSENGTIYANKEGPEQIAIGANLIEKK